MLHGLVEFRCYLCIINAITWATWCDTSLFWNIKCILSSIIPGTFKWISTVDTEVHAFELVTVILLERMFLICKNYLLLFILMLHCLLALLYQVRAITDGMHNEDTKSVCACLKTFKRLYNVCNLKLMCSQMILHCTIVFSTTWCVLFLSY